MTDLTTEAKRELLKYLEHEYECQSSSIYRLHYVIVELIFTEYQYVRKLIEQDLAKVKKVNER